MKNISWTDIDENETLATLQVEEIEEVTGEHGGHGHHRRKAKRKPCVGARSGQQ